MDPRQQVQIARTGVRISRLGLGMASLGDASRTTDTDATDIVASVRGLGLNHVDVAPEYGLGLGEHRLGLALEASGRDGVILSTKVGRLIRPASRRYRLSHTIVESGSSRNGARILGQKLARAGGRRLRPSGVQAARRPAAGIGQARSNDHVDLASLPAAICDFSYDGVMRSFEESLVRLGVDRVDLVFTHHADLHERQAARGAYRALERLRAAGCIDAIGVAVNDAEALVRFADHGEYDCFLLGGRYTLLEQQAIDRLLPLAEDRAIAVLLGGPFNSGILADPSPGALYDHSPANARRVEKALRIAGVCDRHGVPLKAAALQFPFGHPAIASVLIGAASVGEMTEAAELMARPIPHAVWEELSHEGLIDARAPWPTEMGARGEHATDTIGVRRRLGEAAPA